jgi:hypothetical protein
MRCRFSHENKKDQMLVYVNVKRPPLWSSGQSSWLHNGDVLFPVGYELIYVCYVEESRPPL